MTYRPTAQQDPALVHSSTRTSIRTVRERDTDRPKVVLRISRCTMKWIEGALSVRFDGQEIDVTRRERGPRPGRRYG